MTTAENDDVPDGHLRRQIASTPSKFDTQLAGAYGDLTQEIVRDPYVFDFLQ